MWAATILAEPITRADVLFSEKGTTDFLAPEDVGFPALRIRPNMLLCKEFTSNLLAIVEHRKVSSVHDMQHEKVVRRVFAEQSAK